MPLATHEHDQDIAVLSVHDEIDVGTAPMLWEALLPVLERDEGPVVLDLSEVTFMDSTGVHVLLDALGRLEAQKRRLRIACREHGQIHRILALVGLLEAVTVYPSTRSAVLGGDDRMRAKTTGERARRCYARERRMPRCGRTSLPGHRG